MRQLHNLLAAGAFGAALIFAAVPAQAEVIKLSAELSGQNEVPPNGATATGGAEATFDSESMVLSWTVVHVGLSGPVTGAHIHGPSEPSANAGIVFAFENPRQMPIEGSATLTDEQAEALMAGLYYVNIHTEQHPGGELRGHLVPAE